jgi:hypothetical protein
MNFHTIWIRPFGDGDHCGNIRADLCSLPWCNIRKESITMPTLTSARITFQTGDDDKRKESSLEISVRDKSNQIIAQAVDSYGLFDNNTVNGPFDLQILNPVHISAVKSGGSLVLSWTPWANSIGNTDEWHFGLSLDLAFSNGQHVAIAENGLRLTAAQPTVTFGL